jgi:dipeptidyl aminopeptidase/acylaminoacyl peptidase
VSRAGVTDLKEMMEWQLREDGRDSETYKELVKRIGDPKTDTAAFEQASPYRRVAEIQIPVLLIHGRLDNIVPIKQTHMMHKALRKAKKKVEFVDVIGEGHGGWSSENEIRAMKATVEFLEPYLQRDAAVGQASAR